MQNALGIFLSFFLYNFPLLAAASANECLLIKPVRITGELLEMPQGITFENIRTDLVPRFSRPDSFDRHKDTLDLSLFNITINDKKSNFLGAEISIHDKHGNVGLSEYYSGSFHFHSSTENHHGIKVYYTKETRWHTESQHSKDPAITEAWVKVRDGFVISVALSNPVYKVWKTINGVDYLAFTGEHQTLCVTQAHPR